MAGSVKISQLPDGSNQLSAQDQIPFVNNETLETKKVPLSDLQTYLQKDLPLSTDELPEGLTNLYYTDPRARNSIQSIDPSLIYDNTTGNLSLAIDPDEFYTTVEFDSDFSVKTTDSLSEGISNLYYTEDRFDTSFSLKTTTDLVEGSNLYYTRSRFDSDLLARGITGGTLSNTDSLAEGSINLYYEDSRVESFVDSSYVQARQIRQVDYVTTVGYNLSDPSDSSAYILRTYDGLETSTFRGNVIDDNENVIVDANSAIFSGTVMGVLAGTVTNNSGSKIVLDGENSFLNISDITANGTVDFKDAVVVGAHDSAITNGQIISTVDSAYVNARVAPLPETAETVRYVVKAVGSIPVGSVVMFVGASGSQMLASVSDQSHPGFIPEHILGISEQDLLNDEVGFITAFGLVSGVNVVGMTNGDTLYDNPLTNGGLLTVEPSPSDGHSIIVATVVDDELFNNGTLHVNVSRRFNTDEITEGSSNLYYTDDRVNALIDERIDPSQFPTADEFNDVIDARIDSDDFVDLTSDQIIGGIKEFTDSVDVKSLKVGPDLSDSDKATIVFDIGGGSVQELSATSAGISLGEYLLITSEGFDPLEQEVNEISNIIAPLNFDSAENLTVNGSITSIGDSGTSAQWTLAYQWGNHALAGYLTSLAGETDPTVPQHVKDIEEIDLLNYDEAHSWGNHALEGYITSVEAETDPTVPQYVKNITETNISNWTEAYGWGNHSIQGYLTSVDPETDPTVPQHVKVITSTQINSWDTAYSWGDHSIGNYLTEEVDPTVPQHVKVITSQEINSWNEAHGWGDHASAGYFSASGGTISGVLTVTGDVLTDEVRCRTGQQLVLSAGESSGQASGQTAEIVYVNAEGGLQVNSHPTNWTGSEWAGRNTATICGANGTSTFPAQVNVTGHGNSSQWNTAYGWGDHASKGYFSGTSGGLIQGNTTILSALTVGNGANANHVLDLKKGDNNISDHVRFYNGTTRVGEIGCEDDTWLRINQETNKNIFTPRYIRADAGFFVDGTTKGINGSGNFIGGTITGASDANVSNWNTAYGWGDHASAGYYSGNITARCTAGNLGESSNTWPIQVYQPTAGTDAMMSFHVAGDFAFNFGLDGSTNKLSVGGWSLGANMHEIYHSGNKGTLVERNAAQDISANWEFQDNIELRFGNSADVRMDWNGTDFYCRSYFASGRLLFQGADTAGTNRALVYMDPDAATSLYHAGVQKGYTYGSGWRVTGNLLATSDVYAYYSDERLKDVVGTIDNPVDKVKSIDTFFYTHNDTARELGYEGAERQIGVSAQSVKEVLPEVIHRAPIDDDGEGGSVSGEDYMTVDYPRLVPLLIEAIKQLSEEVEELRGKL